MGVLFWVCLAVGVLLKGVIAPLVVGFDRGGLLLWERKASNWARPLLYWPGISLFCIITIPWYIAVQIATEGEFLLEAAAVDLGQKIVSAAEGHKGPPGMHIAALPILFWPGTLLLIPGIWLGVATLTAHAQERRCRQSGQERGGARLRRARGWRLALPRLLGRAVVDRVRARADQARFTTPCRCTRPSR